MMRPETDKEEVASESTPLLRPAHPSIQKEDADSLVEVRQGYDEFDDDLSVRFSFRRLLSFVGPGFLVSIAYLDPGNIEADLQSGTAVGYKLLWVLLWSTVLGLLTQRIAARIGVVTGYQMSELCHRLYPLVPRILLWIMMEIAIIGSDIQEVIGTAIAFNILSNKKIPVWGGVLITLLDTFTFLLLENYGLKRLEYFFAFLIAIMAGTFGYEYVLSSPDQLSVIKGIFIPYCTDCNSYTAWLQGIGIVGACIMPHNLYLHSYLVKTRDPHSREPRKIREGNLYNLIETGFSLFVSFIINLFVISVFAKGLFNETNASVHKMCLKHNNTEGADEFKNNNETVSDMNIYRGGIYLGCAYGSIALYVWAVGILAAGQSSTMTGTYSGQVIMEGFLNLKWKRWKRILVTRSLAVLPTLFLALYRGIKDLTDLNDDMNVLMTIQLPFALVPALTLSNSPYVMRQFRNGGLSKFILSVISFAIIVVNFYSFVTFMQENLAHTWWMWLIMAILMLLYASFIIYLLIFQFALEGYDNAVVRLVVKEDSTLRQKMLREGSIPPPPEGEGDTASPANSITT